jgi:hypothetical protein
VEDRRREDLGICHAADLGEQVATASG